jgi:hypothetical protein
MKLDDIRKGDFFTTPERYFDELPMRIQSRLPKRDVAHLPELFRNRTVRIAVASALALAVCIPLWLFGPASKVVTAESILAGISADDVVAYLIQSDLSQDDIITYLTESDLELHFEEDYAAPIPPGSLEEGDLDELILLYGLEDEFL